jgi:hypothetical protein
MKTRFRYWARHDRESERSLTQGIFDDKAVFVFTSGQCHSFALAMQRLAGWGLVGRYYGKELEHLMVFDPATGLVIDAEHTLIGLVGNFRLLKRAPRFDRLCSIWFPLQVGDAIPFAKARLEQLRTRPYGVSWPGDAAA